MKKVQLLILVFCLTAGTALSQGIYLRLGAGGGIGLKQYEYYWYDENETSSADNCTFKSMGLGSGFNINLAAGYMTSQYFGFELGVNEFIAMARKIKQTSTTSYGDYNAEIKLKGMMLQLVPAIIITPGLEEGINPYARIGMIAGILPSMTESYEATSSSNEYNLKATHTEVYKSKIKGGIALGFTAAAGAAFNLGEKISLYAELVYNGLTYSPKKGKYTEWTYDGADQLATATTNEKEWTYEKEIDFDQEIPDGTPDKEPKITANLSNVEVNVGIRIKF